MDLNGKKFKLESASQNSELGTESIFIYEQEGHLIWSDYSGPGILKGNLLGSWIDDEHISFHYHQINVKGELRSGRCRSRVEEREGRIHLIEEWQWDDSGEKGKSVLIEVL